MVRSIKKVSPALEDLPHFFQTLFKTWNIQPRFLAVASRAVWKPAKRKFVARSLKGLAPHIQVTSDVEAAWLAAFGRLRVKSRGWRVASSQGVLLIAGTGSIAYAKDSRGRVARAGGLGPEKGDEGSGYWIGREWAKAAPHPLTPDAVRKMAERAPAVWRLAQKKNLRAQHIIREAQHHLARLVVELATSMTWKGVLPVACAGSVLAHPGFRKGFVRALKKVLGRRKFRIGLLHTDSATAVAQSIMQMYG
jgi:N-acetylglucosamine kinase-like BadF-type ATPase